MSLYVAGRVGSGHPTQLVMLVGSNPLPNYLTACALRPSKVALVYTKETEEAKNRLRSELGSPMRAKPA